MWKRLYNTESGMEKGTLYQLRNAINRRNVTKAAKSDVNANEDFLEVAVTGYILVAAMSFLGMTDLHGAPDASLVPPCLWMVDLDESERSSILAKIASAVVDNHVDLAISPGTSNLTSTYPATTTLSPSDPTDPPTGSASSPPNNPATNPPTNPSTDPPTNLTTTSPDPTNPSTSGLQSASSVYNYTREVISLGLLYLNFKDAVREGDGERVLLTWKYFLVMFRATGHRNYAMEALTLLTQCLVTLPPNLAEQVKWNRFINTHGHPGQNITMDLFMEHLNRIIKTAIDGLGANKTERAIVRAGKCVGCFANVLERFDGQAGIAAVSGKHSEQTISNDLKEIVQQLLEADVFDTSHAHKSFSKLKPNLVGQVVQKDLKDWIIDNLCKYTSCH